MKVYMGTSVVYEEFIKDRPVAVTTLMDSARRPNLPMIAVAAGSCIYFYKDMEPFMMFELPLIEFSEEESKIWGELIKLTKIQSREINEDATESS